MEPPISRVYACFPEDSETPGYTRVQSRGHDRRYPAAGRLNEINIANAGGGHRELVPDGRLCGAGRAEHRAFGWTPRDARDHG
ncbi:lytic polysaccharide monooxygenase [Streptosporangium sp. CA-135522]|uniref:lytic polysaccharide monooxygenase n=1 Tax=Streptosporangium sp. CA-135522 TaxID=3240072 RepID=UPI003D8F1E96